MWAIMGHLEDTIKERLKRLGNQTELAERSGVGQSRISRFLKPGGTMTSDGLFVLLERLGAKIIFPGDIEPGCTTPEAAKVDAAIKSMRLSGMSEKAVAAGAIGELEESFSKNSLKKNDKERKLAS
jgi:hypothetical protein